VLKIKIYAFKISIFLPILPPLRLCWTGWLHYSSPIAVPLETCPLVAEVKHADEQT